MRRWQFCSDWNNFSAESQLWSVCWWLI